MSEVSVRFIDPKTGAGLIEQGDALLNERSGEVVASIIDGLPRFVNSAEDYAESFGYQWNKWTTLSDHLNKSSSKFQEITQRTHFNEYPTDGATILECGMGGGDDTEALLQFPFREVHAFDLSRSVDRAFGYLSDPRLTLSQASIFDIPYEDESFDFVFCHRVLQHTPDPQEALRCVCRKVKPGGVLFAHSYKRSPRHMKCFKYKYRWLTRRLPHRAVYWYVTTFGPLMNLLNRALFRLGRIGRKITHDWVPFYHYKAYLDLSPERLRDLEELNTFDALTPAYDIPMESAVFCGIIEEEGFTIEHLDDDEYSPIFCTAVKHSKRASPRAVDAGRQPR